MLSLVDENYRMRGHRISSSKKRSRPDHNNNNDANSNAVDKDVPPSSITSPPLQGVVACLTGIHPDVKDRFHQIIEDLGGK
jgi:hypothetical protein